MKRFITLGLVMSMILCIAGCTSSQEGSKSQSQAPKPISEFKVGLGSITNIGGSKPEAVDNGPSALADVTMCSLVLDKEGKIASVSFDAVQASIAYDKEGKLKSDPKQEIKTKKQLGGAYGMKKVSPIGKEWDEQVKAFEQFLVGKTIEEIVKMPVTKKDEAKAVPDVPELKSSCTIDVSGFVGALGIAEKNAE